GSHRFPWLLRHTRPPALSRRLVPVPESLSSLNSPRGELTGEQFNSPRDEFDGRELSVLPPARRGYACADAADGEARSRTARNGVFVHYAYARDPSSGRRARGASADAARRFRVEPAAFSRFPGPAVAAASRGSVCPRTRWAAAAQHSALLLPGPAPPRPLRVPDHRSGRSVLRARYVPIRVVPRGARPAAHRIPGGRRMWHRSGRSAARLACRIRPAPRRERQGARI